MKRNFKRIASELNREYQLVFNAHNDQKVDDQKMRDDLLPFFQDPNELDGIIHSHTHVWDYSIFLAIQKDEGKLDGFKAIFDIMQNAQERPETFKQIEEHYYPTIREALLNAHDAAHLQQEEVDYCCRTDITAIFQSISFYLEGCVLPMLKQIASQYHASISKFQHMPFGGIVSHLWEIKELHYLLAPFLWDIPIHQIRNIASHNSYKLNTKKKTIVCNYGRGNNRSITIPTKYMNLFLCELYLTCYTIKAALMLSMADSSWAHKGLARKSDISLDTLALSFGGAIVSQGLKIIEFNYQGPTWKLEAVDTLYRGEWAVREIFNNTAKFISIADVEVQYRVQITEEGHIFYGTLTTKRP